ncbi:winged helix DNA-binding domain-containing protein [Streptomyces sp. NPDC058274]|uniref:winged helix DNA-binding domain-containing protein n=1 Tax=Streptomyces sp. NPDC058274 TaxID=3346416 RepID=UPI0036E46425
MPTHTTAHDRGALSLKALNRAFLDRQMLLRRRTLPAQDAIEHLVGLQAQAPTPPYYGLWTRLTDFRQDELAALLTSREAVRIAMMRGTVHLVTARDCLRIRPWLQPFMERSLGTTFGKELNGVDLAELAVASRDLIEEEPRTTADLGKLLQERWPDRAPSTLVNAVRALLPLVQVPPRGIWGLGGQTTYATAEKWLGAPLEPTATPEHQVLRYLAAFGPASVKDVQAWSGLTRLRAVIERLRPDLVTFRDPSGAELFDLPDAPRPDPDTPAPARYLAPYDNAILSHADRTRIISDEDRKAIATKNAVIPGTILLDGFVHGVWRVEQEGSTATLHVRPFRPVSAAQRAELEEEGERLLAFAADSAGTRNVRLGSVRPIAR